MWYHFLAIVMIAAIIRGVFDGIGDNFLGLGMAVLILLGCISNIKEEKQKKEQQRLAEEERKRREESPFFKPDSGKECYKWPLKEGVIPDDPEIMNNSFLHYRKKSNFDAIIYFIERLYETGHLYKYLTPDMYFLIAGNTELRKNINMKNDAREHLYSHMDTVSKQTTVVQFMKLIHYYEFDDIDKIISWCRSRTEYEMAKMEGTEGYSLTGHYLALKDFLPERREDESIRDYLYRISGNTGCLNYG